MAASRTLGIDFGTSTLLVGHRSEGGSAQIVPVGQSTTWMPTVAAPVSSGDSLAFGEEAVGFGELSLIRSVKSVLASDETSVRRTSPDGEAVEVCVDDVVVALLREAVRRAEVADPSVKHCTNIRLGCPAVWDGATRDRLSSLANKAGLAVGAADLLDEPIAAGISWVTHRRLAGHSVPEGRTLVFDYGGGTLDVALLEVEDGPKPEITVLSAAGFNEAGDSLDSQLADHLTAELVARDVDLDTEAEDVRRVLEMAAGRLKMQLTDAPSAATTLPAAYGSQKLSLKRSDLDSVFAPQLERAIQLTHGVLRGAELRVRGSDPASIKRQPIDSLVRSVDHVLLAGGMSRIPSVGMRLSQEFPHAHQARDPLIDHPEEAVVSGLTLGEVVSRLNLHRPGFSFVLEDERGDRHTLYQAFTPLYSPAQVMAGQSQLGVPCTVTGLTPRAFLYCESMEGERLPLDIDNTVQDQLTFRTLNGRVQFKLYVDGRIALQGRQSMVFRVERWPVLRSQDGSGAAFRLRTDRSMSEWDPIDDPGWWRERN
ncbi:MAG: Hsp70 family protein [Acidimicrobiia bacterium]|nr:Hsp70 family protein [Acidimicrobiia bacterium]